MSQLPPIRREVVVDLDPDRAFELFTARIGDWWPLASHSVFGAGASVTFTGDKRVEMFGERTAVWGEVIESQPGALLVISWHAEHSDWEARKDPAAVRREYDNGWPPVLDAYAAAVTSSAISEAETG